MISQILSGLLLFSPPADQADQLDDLFDLESETTPKRDRYFSNGEKVPEGVFLDDESTWSDLSMVQKEELRAQRAMRDIALKNQNEPEEQENRPPTTEEMKEIISKRHRIDSLKHTNLQIREWERKQTGLTVGAAVTGVLFFGALGGSIATSVIVHQKTDQCLDEDLKSCDWIIEHNPAILQGATWGPTAGLAVVFISLTVASSIHKLTKPKKNYSFNPNGLEIKF